MKTSTVFLCLTFFLSTTAHSAVIDFDSEPVGTARPLLIDGFIFDTPTSAWTPEIIEESAGNNALFLQGVGQTDPFGQGGPIFIEMTSQTGDPFAFYGADFIGTAAVGTVSFTILGFTTGGAVASDPIGTGDWLNLETVRFGVSSCCSPSIEVLTLTIDNVNANVVPVPAAAWLFGSALAGLGWLRRKQSK